VTGYAALRARLENDLLALVEPGRFLWVPAQKKLDKLAKPTLMLKLASVSRSTVAQGVLVPAFILTVVSEHLDPVQADVALDELLDELLAPINSLRWVVFRGADKAAFQTKYMCYDIQLEALTAIKKGA
jgi:hypothetical protein